MTIQRILSHLRTPLYGNAYALLLSSATTSALGLLYWILAARFYSAEVVGLNSAVISAVLFLAGAAQLSLNNVLVRFIPVAGLMTPQLVGYSYLIGLAVSCFAGGFFLLGLNIWSPAMNFLKGSPGWSFSFLLMVMAWCIFTLQDSVFTGLRQAIWVPIENIIFAVVKIILLVALANTFQREGIFISWGISVVISLIPVNLLIFLRLIPGHSEAVSENPKPILLGELVKFASGNYLGTLFFIASTSLLPVIVTNLAGIHANAYFYPAWTIAAGLQFIASNMSISLTVEASLDQANLVVYSRRILVQIARLVVPIVIVVVLGAHFFLSAFGQTYAEEGTSVLQLLTLGIIPNILVNLSLSLARVQNRAGVIVLIQGALCGLILGLSLLLIPFFGIQGLGYAWIISQTTIATVLIFTELRSVLFLKSSSWIKAT